MGRAPVFWGGWADDDDDVLARSFVQTQEYGDGDAGSELLTTMDGT